MGLIDDPLGTLQRVQMENTQVITLKKNDTVLLGAAALFLAIFVVGFVLDITRLMLAGIFFCIVVQGMRR